MQEFDGQQSRAGHGETLAPITQRNPKGIQVRKNVLELVTCI